MDEKQSKNNSKDSDFSTKSVAMIGLYGGLFFAGFAEFAWFFHFIELNPNQILKPLQQPMLEKGWLRIVAALAAYAIISLGIALLYYALFRKRKSMWAGILFGFVLWILLFLAFNPLLPRLPHWRKMETDTLVTTLSLFILYGLFIGYSISYAYELARENTKKQQKRALSK
ncbi:putative permease [Bacillus ectoiniformans]|uniref:YqhR family membrane protein n=1 Tax=Bacillus ectoiniformans TaxID=1494429 RepID=UPI00195C68E8|nr:YqhR family membrane protein [Bacillus ectoiniformans]MBM7650448.1 putative permease [Bacillus ectoiniformans]